MIGRRGIRPWVEDPLALAVQIAHDAVVVVDMAGRIVLVNDRLLTMTGFDEAALRGEPLRTLFPFDDGPDPRLAFLDRYHHPAEDPDPEGHGEVVKVARRDGSEFSAKLSLTSLCSPEHGPVGVVAIRGLRELTLEEVGLRGLLDSAPDATLVLDNRCHVVLANRRAGELFGQDHVELREQPADAVFVAPESAKLVGWLRDRHHDLVAGHEDGWTSPFMASVERPDGTRTPVEVSVTGLALDGGMLMRAAVRDVSERLALQAEADRMKVNFLATISHELRTPLTSILGYAEMHAELEDAQLAHAGRHFVEVIGRNAHREMRLVDDLLTIVGFAEGNMAVRPGLVNLPGVVRQAVEEAEPAAHAAGVELRVEIEAEPATVRGDADRLGQALDNVLSNAIKFTPTGGRVRVRLRVQPGVASAIGQIGAGLVHVVVTDDGPGFDEAERRSIFGRFQRGHLAVAMQKPGVGLGLSIVKAIVEAHGGSVAVDSAATGGAVLDIALPVAPESDPRR